MSESDNPPTDNPSLGIIHNEPVETDNIVIENLEFLSVMDNDIEEIRRFVHKERDDAVKFRDAIGDDPESRERMNAQMTHTIYGLGPLEKRHGKKGYLIRARSSSRSLVGFGIINLDYSIEEPDRATLFFGRAWKEKQKGIGSKLLSKEVDYLKIISDFS